MSNLVHKPVSLVSQNRKITVSIYSIFILLGLSTATTAKAGIFRKMEHAVEHAVVTAEHIISAPARDLKYKYSNPKPKTLDEINTIISKYGIPTSDFSTSTKVSLSDKTDVQRFCSYRHDVNGLKEAGAAAADLAAVATALGANGAIAAGGGAELLMFTGGASVAVVGATWKEMSKYFRKSDAHTVCQSMGMWHS